MTFQGSIKGCTNVLSLFLTYFSIRTDRLSSSHIFRAGQTYSLPHIFFEQNRPTFNTRRASFNHGPLFLLEISPLSSIHSSLTNWTLKLHVKYLIPALTSTTAFFHFVRLTVQGLSFQLSLKLFKIINILVHIWGCPRGVMVKVVDCGIVVREFVLQSHYYVHFRANTLPPLFFYKNGFGIK